MVEGAGPPLSFQTRFANMRFRRVGIRCSHFVCVVAVAVASSEDYSSFPFSSDFPNLAPGHTVSSAAFRTTGATFLEAACLVVDAMQSAADGKQLVVKVLVVERQKGA